jgi:hypothetical protein
MGSACLAATGDVDRGTPFSECASNPFADTATAPVTTATNSSFLLIPASLRQSRLDVNNDLANLGIGFEKTGCLLNLVKPENTRNQRPQLT